MSAGAQTIVEIAVDYHVELILGRHLLAVASLVCGRVENDVDIYILQHGLIGCETIADAILTLLFRDVVLQGTALSCLVDVEFAVVYVGKLVVPVFESEVGVGSEGSSRCEYNKLYQVVQLGNMVFDIAY